MARSTSDDVQRPSTPEVVAPEHVPVRSFVRELRPAGQRAPSDESNAGGLWFATAMFVLCHAWLGIVREVDASAWALTSYALQQAVLWGAFVLVDDRLSRRSTRFVWAAVGTLCATFTILDGLLMRMTSLPLREILPMLLASQQVIEGLREIGISPSRLSILLALLIAAAAGGGAGRLLLGKLFARAHRARPFAAWNIAWLSLLPVAFVCEQTLSRDADDYLYRGFRMPGYLQLYSTSSKSVVMPLSPPVEHKKRAQWLETIGPAKNPRHVLYVLLESFRADAVTQLVTPTLWQLSQQGLSFDGALAEATYTPLSWSVLLFDEAAHDNLFGRHPGRREPLGSWLLAVMGKAGYQPHVSVSTNLSYAKTRTRLLGSQPQQLDFFQAAADVGDDPADKNTNDRVAADHLISFIQQHAWHEPSEQPQFMLLQLDSTHYTYPFPQDQALFAPYSANLLLPEPIETDAEAALLRNRYLNAAHFVDTQLSRVIAALKLAGVYDDMVVVLTADHGEGLNPGDQGHGAVHEATKRVPLMFKFPGEAPRHSKALISHRDILPRLSQYLGITLPDAATRGHTEATPEPAVLTVAPSGRFGQLTTPQYTVNLRLLYKPDSVTVTPTTLELLGKHGASHQTPKTSEWLPHLTRFLATNPAKPTANASRQVEPE